MNCKPYIRAHADELLESLAALVRIPSVEGVPEEHAPFGREPARALHETLALCEKLGFRTGNMDDRVGWCEYGEGEEMVAVLGHLDVVPAGDGWTETEPFSGEIKVSELREKVFPGSPEMLEELDEKLDRYNLSYETVAPKNEQTIKKFQKQKLYTDTGIEITIPMEEYRNPDHVEFITNMDGTISVLIKNIGMLSSK